MNFKPLHIIFILGALLIFSCKSPTTFEIASEGVLTIDSIQKKEIHSLDGNWEFYWNQLLTPDDFIDYSKDTVNYVKVNSVWNKYIVDGQEIGKFGYGTFHIKLIIPKGEYSFKLKRIETAYNFWVNDELLVTNGTVGKDKKTSKPRLYPQIVNFKTDRDTTDITIQVSNFHHRVGGIQNKIFIGKPQTIYDIQTSYLFVIYFIIGSFLLIAGYFLFNYFISKNAGLAPLYFSLTILSSIVFATVSSDSHYTFIFHELPWEYIKKLDYIGNYGRIMFFILFVRSIFNKEKSINNRFSQIIIYIFAFFYLIIIFTKPIVFTNTLYPFLIASFAVLVFIAIQLFRLGLKKDIRARIILFGITVIIITMLNDSLSYSNIINTPDLANFGLFVFTISNAVVLSISIASATNTSKRYTELWEKVNNIRDEFSEIKPFELDKMFNILSNSLESPEAAFFIKNKENFKCEIVHNNKTTKVSYLNSPIKYDVNKLQFDIIKKNKELIFQEGNILFPVLEKEIIKAIMFFKNTNIKRKYELDIIEMLHSEISTFIDNYKYFYGLENINKNLETIISTRTNTIVEQKEKLIQKSVSLDAKIEELNITNSIVDDLNTELIESAGAISANISILESKNEEIKTQKDNIEKKISTISSSISYSKLIQKTLLGASQKVLNYKYFEFSSPKSMVGGDIWFSKIINNYTVIGIVDSTGSNVTSTFLTMLISSLFEDAMNKHPEVATKEPNVFISNVKKAFFKIIDKNKIVDDNFEVFYCSINTDSGKMLYCGENLVGHILRENKIFELLSDKKVIMERKNIQFTLHNFDLKHNDTLYLQTDGFINQIRKLDMKKYGRLRMNEFISSLNKTPFNKQKETVIEEYNNWKQRFKQVDDYLIIGLLYSDNEI